MSKLAELLRSMFSYQGPIVDSCKIEICTTHVQEKKRIKLPYPFRKHQKTALKQELVILTANPLDMGDFLHFEKESHLTRGAKGCVHQLPSMHTQCQ